jgi:hypothetical protein
MSLKLINLTIPNEKPDLNISSFSPEENYLMLKIGSSCLLEGRKVVGGLTQNELYEKIKNESKNEILKLERDILLEKELSKKMEERIAKIYEGQVEQLKKQLEVTRQRLQNYEFENKDIINKEVEKAKEKFELLLQEKDKQNQLNREVFDKASLLINKTNTKSSVSIGDDGENIFENLSETFKDFIGYKIENKSKQGHKGDFHLFFEEFNVLVDSKNYSGNVQKKEVIKIESDLMINDNMKFAWMVSLNTSISDYNRFPITIKWITTDVGVKCILFINNLLTHKDPANILRQAWYICNEFNKMTKKVCKEDGELEKYREQELKQKKQIKNLQERTNEIRRSINTSYNILKHMDNDLLEMLSEVSNDIVNDKFALNDKINNWWDSNIEFSNDESKLTSTEIWNRFKKDKKEYIGENKINIEIFKEKITSIVNCENYVEKNKKGAIEFIGYKFKQEVENIIITENLIKKKKIKIYFSEEQDIKILKEYEDEKNNIMSISMNNNIKPWQVVSVLVSNKIIEKRDESRGYDIYKETEEYKQKLNK